MIGALGHVHLFDESMKLDVSQGLCKAVCNYLVGWDIREFDSLWGHLITDVVVLDIDMFGPGVEDWVVGQSYRSLVVACQWDDDLFLSPFTRFVKVVEAVLDGVSTRVLFGDLDQGVLFV